MNATDTSEPINKSKQYKKDPGMPACNMTLFDRSALVDPTDRFDDGADDTSVLPNYAERATWQNIGTLTVLQPVKT